MDLIEGIKTSRRASMSSIIPSLWEMDLIEGIKTSATNDQHLTCRDCRLWEMDLIEGIKTLKTEFKNPRLKLLLWEMDLIEGIKTIIFSQ